MPDDPDAMLDGDNAAPLAADIAAAPKSYDYAYSDSTPANIDRQDHPDARFETVRDSLTEISAYLSDSAAATAHGGITQNKIETVWKPLAGYVNSFLGSWNAAMERLKAPYLRAEAVCQRNHELECKRDHNPPCNHKTAPVQTAGKSAGGAKPQAAPAAAKTSGALKSASASYVTAISSPPRAQIPSSLWETVANKKKVGPAHFQQAVDYVNEGLTPKVAVDLAARDAPRASQPKTKARSLPANANKTIYVPLPTQDSALQAALPTSADLGAALTATLAQENIINLWCGSSHLPDKKCQGTHTFELPVLAHVDVQPDKVAFVFKSPVPRDEQSDHYSFIANMCVLQVKDSIKAAHPVAAGRLGAQLFHFRSSVVFSNVPPIAARTKVRYTAEDFEAQIRASPTWAGVVPTRVHYWSPGGEQDISTSGCLFVDFQDDKFSTILKRLTNIQHRTLIADEYRWCRPANPSSKAVNAPQCNGCQRWGHISTRCTSRFHNCAICAGAHSTSQHALLASDAAIKCFNCGGKHRADSKECAFYEHRADKKWRSANAPKYDRTTKKWTYYKTRQSGEARTTSAV